MTLTDCQPHDLVAFLAGRKLTPGTRTYARLLTQCLTSTSWAAYPDSDPVPVAVGGVYVWGDGRPAEVWFAANERTPRHMAPLALAVRRRLRSLADAGQDMITRVADGNRPGERFAAALGFEHGAEPDIWRYRCKP